MSMDILPHDVAQTHKCYEQACVYKATTVVHLTCTVVLLFQDDHVGEFLEDLII